MKYLIIALLCVLGALLALGLICLIRALRIKKSAPSGTPAVSWTPEEAKKYAADLSEMVKIPTVSRSQEEEYPDFLRFQARLKELFPRVFAAAENHDVEGNLLRKLPGSAPERGALLLMGHQDVVPAEGQSGWTLPPFSGEIRDGCVWGRGAMDCKSTLCCELEAIEALLEEGFVFKEDLWLFAARNEENSGGGSEAAAEYLKKQGVRLNVVLDEGGAVVDDMFPGLRYPAAGVGVAEKGFVNVKFTARSAGGHASTPPRNSPIARLSKFVAAAEKKSVFKKKLLPPVPASFTAVAPYLPLPLRFLLGNLWLFGGLLTRVLPAVSPMAGAFVQTTAAFTMSGGSEAPNVLPDAAWVICNMRPSLHQSADESVAALKKLADKYDIETEVLFSRDASAVTDSDGAEFRFLAECISACIPDAVVLPYLMTGGTDSRRFETVCDNVLRFTPTRLTPQQLAAMHAANENIGVETLAEGVKTYKYYVERYNSR